MSIMALEAPQNRPTRTGGRSARVRAAVLRSALEEIVARGPASSIAGIAERAGVHPTSIYRRWVSLERLVMDAALTAAAREVLIPDTGSLAGDLTSFLSQLDAHIRSPLGTALLSLSGLTESAAADARAMFWRERFARAKEIFARGVTMGEVAPELDLDVALQLAIAPLYLRAMILREPTGPQDIARLVAMLLPALSPPR
jgi:AcrR family transcriptional regulator